MSFAFNFDGGDHTAASTSDSPVPHDWKRQRTASQPSSRSWDEWWERAASAAVALPPDQALVQYAWHFDMINDSPRNAAFRQSIEAVLCAACHGQKSEKHVHVLDVGTGSGLLAMLAAKSGASQVTAFEAEPAVARVATRNVGRNALSETVRVVAMRSTAGPPQSQENIVIEPRAARARQLALRALSRFASALTGSGGSCAAAALRRLGGGASGHGAARRKLHPGAARSRKPRLARAALPRPASARARVRPAGRERMPAPDGDARRLGARLCAALG